MRHSRRSAFTLLEVLLASAIGVLLMAALYVAVDMQLHHAQVGRDVIEQGTLVRALVNRITADVNASIGPMLPANPSAAGSSSGGTGTGSTAPPSGSSASSTAGGPGTSGTGSGSSGSAGTTPTGQPQFSQGVQGDANRLILFISRVPRELYFGVDTPNTDGQPGFGDLRRVTYWLAGGNGSASGLARQEVKHVTSDDEMNAVPPDVSDEGQYVIADEVTSLSFSYFDGNAWQDSWDGTQPGPDGVTPMGPPMAIAVSMGIALPGSGGGERMIKTYRHVVAILPANNPTPQTLNSSTGQ